MIISRTVLCSSVVTSKAASNFERFGECCQKSETLFGRCPLRPEARVLDRSNDIPVTEHANYAANIASRWKKWRSVRRSIDRSSFAAALLLL